MHTLETRTAPPKEESQADTNPSTLGFVAPMMMNDTLMIANAPAYGGKHILKCLRNLYFPYTLH